MIDKVMIEKLRSLPIEQVADALGMGLRWHNAICPFHNDSHPSLHFSTSHNTYHCYVCGKHGGTIDLVMHRMNLNFHDACCWLAQAFGLYIEDDGRTGDRGCRYENSAGRFADVKPRKVLPLEPSRPVAVDTEYLNLYVAHPVLNAEAEHFLLGERRLRREVIEWCHVSSISDPTPCRRFGKPFYDAPSLLIPYYTREGRLLSVQSRYLGTDENGAGSKQAARAKGVARFKFPKGSECHVYNLQILNWVSPGEPLFITEGCTDCWAMMSAGHKAIAIPSATLLKEEDLRPLQDLNLHIFPDADEPGERLYLQLKDLLPQLVRHQLPKGCEDFSEYYIRLVGNN